MHIAFVTPAPPSHQRPRSLVFLQALAQRHTLTVICLCRSPREIAEAGQLRGLGVRVVPVFEDAALTGARRLGAALTREPFQMAYEASPRLRAALLTELARGDIDLVHVEHLRCAQTMLGLAQLSIPVVWDAGESASRLHLLRAALGSSLPRRAAHHLEAQRLRACERALLGTFSQVVVATEADREALVSDRSSGDHERAAWMTTGPAPQVVVIPTPIDAAYFTAAPGERDGERLVYWGSLRTPEGVAAASWLLRAVMPRIWAVSPEVRLSLVGDDQPAHRVATMAGSDARVRLVGAVADPRPYLGSASVALSPFRSALGAALPTLAALASATPVVASESALEGLRVVPGRDLLVAGTPDRYARMVLRLLDDRALGAALARSGRAYVEREHAPEVVARQFEALYWRATGHGTVVRWRPASEASAPARSAWTDGLRVGLAGLA